MNQAERDMLTFLDANDVITPLPHDQKEMFLNIKLFSCYCETRAIHHVLDKNFQGGVQSVQV